MLGKRRFYFMVVCIMVFSIVLSACGSNSSKSNEGNQPAANAGNQPAGNAAPAEKVKLKVATWAGAGELKEFQDLIDKLNASATDYQIEVQSIPADYYVKLQTMVAAHQAPDFMWLSQEYVPQYASLGAIAPLDDPLASVSSFQADDYYPGPLNVGKVNGKIYGLPWISQPYMLYYNQDMFDNAGVAAPTNDWTWDDFVEAGKKLTKDGQWGALLNNMPTAMYTWSYGGDIFDTAGKIVLDSPESIQGLQMYQTIVKSGIMPQRAQADSMGNGDMFKTGKVAMYIGGAGDDVEKTSKFKVGMVVPPKGTQQVTFSWMAVTAMSSTTKNPAIAAKALNDMTLAIHKWKVVAPTKSGFDLISTSNPDKTYAVDAIRKGSEVARGFNNQPKEGEIDGAIWEKLTQPIESGSDITAAVKATIAKFNDINK
ncbi:sugar ABC transporter substrate-binding protein [Paenibacillus rhizovicinus]|uniref:Sugar ABC transporter substrate-binding protein n=1 Tax=Paenibacillus rhizovicinus TaxID=2704463 RepID=A0A6C0P221_9BACL|nr:sugar ABC transporter substrate-binding protein [Paenibacillus rhizovicinus]QHW31923.1 sugar ABC transporter substrate-binding protein [Paenibacillus rhizovicinus]